MRYLFALTFLLFAVAVQPLLARNDIMPPPKSAPLIPVDKQVLFESKHQMVLAKKEEPPKPRLAVKVKTTKASVTEIESEPNPKNEIEGGAVAIDGERINVGDKTIRLFGIMTPAMSSHYGTKSQEQLQGLLQGTVLCKLTGKDSEGVAVAFCGTVDVPDISYEMLRQGWAMADAATLEGNSLFPVYAEAEKEAQAANRGIFAPTPMATVISLTDPAKSLTIAMPQADATQDGTQKIADISEAAQAAAGNAPDNRNFVERYQNIIAAAILLLAAALYASITMIKEGMRMREARRSVAAALRGELLAARHIFRTKSRDLIYLRPQDSKTKLRANQLWPRVRTVVYQANISSLGLLGSELARRVASVYGQCTDYAAYFQQATRLPSAKAVAETLTVLAGHMDVVLEGLAQVEATGKAYRDKAVDVAIPQDETVSDNQKPEADKTTEEKSAEEKKDISTAAPQKTGSTNDGAENQIESDKKLDPEGEQKAA